MSTLLAAVVVGAAATPQPQRYHRLPAPTDRTSLQIANQVVSRSPQLAPHAFKVVPAPGPVTPMERAPVRKSFQPELDRSGMQGGW